MQLSAQAFEKVVLHSSKYSFKKVIGLLLTDSTSKTISKIIPLSHTALPLASFYETAFEFIEAYASSNGFKVSGVYFCNEDTNDFAVPGLVTELYNKIIENFDKNATVISIDFKALRSNNPIKSFIIENKQWKQGSNVEFGQSQESIDELNHKILSKKFKEVYDFDDHLDDINRNWIC